MSLCQSKNTSCGACCGILNLDLNKNEIQTLIKDRTHKFNLDVDFSKNWTIAEYRKIRENEESIFNRKDDTTYVCPFLGYIDNKKIGCMIHPSITGNPLSQNFSFYGASICQGYECKNKERSDTITLENFFQEIQFDSYYEYSNIISDHVTLKIILDFFYAYGYNLDKIFQEKRDLFLELLFLKFKKGILLNQTSFEFEETSDEDVFGKLLRRLLIDTRDEIYGKLQELSKNPLRGF